MLRLTRASLKEAETLLRGCEDPDLCQQLLTVAEGSTRAAVTPLYEGSAILPRRPAWTSGRRSGCMTARRRRALTQYSTSTRTR